MDTEPILPDQEEIDIPAAETNAAAEEPADAQPDNAEEIEAPEDVQPEADVEVAAVEVPAESVVVAEEVSTGDAEPEIQEVSVEQATLTDELSSEAEETDNELREWVEPTYKSNLFGPIWQLLQQLQERLCGNWGKTSGSPIEGGLADLRTPLLSVASGEEDDFEIRLGSNTIRLDQETLETWGVDRETLNALVRMEDRYSIGRWTYLEHLFEKLSYWSLLKERDVTGKVSAVNHVWTHGRGLPLTTKRALIKARGSTGFKQGIEFAVLRPIQLILYSLLGYQLHESLMTKNAGSFIPEAFDILLHGREQSIRGILSAMVSDPANAPYLWSLLGLPVVWGGIKAGLYGRRALIAKPEDLQEATRVLRSHPTSSEYRCKGSLFFRCGAKQTWWWNFGRWLLPLHYIDRELNYVTHALLLNGKIPLGARREVFDAVVELVERNGGYTKIAGLHALQKLADGVALRQFGLLEESYEEEYREDLLREKAKALATIRRFNRGIKQSWQENKLCGLVYNTYAHYLRWGLGDWDSRTVYTSYTIFKIGKTIFLINLTRNIVSQILDYLSCPLPYEQGFTHAMEAKGKTNYTQACFDAVLNAFNKVPGQPVCTIVELLPQIDFDLKFNFLNLAGKGLTGAVVAELLDGLKKYQPQVKITRLDLSGNQINRPEDFTVLFPKLGIIEHLWLSGNSIGLDPINPERATNGTIALGEGLRHVPHLEALYLSDNRIGHDARGTKALGLGLRHVPQLLILDLSSNWLDSTGTNGTEALGYGLEHVPLLENLDVSDNWIGHKGTRGTEALGHGMRYVPGLLEFYLLSNYIGYTGTQGVIALGHGLEYVPGLQVFDISNNYIGYSGTNGTEALRNGLQSVPGLLFFDFSHNQIGGDTNVIFKLIIVITRFKYLEALFVQQPLAFSQDHMNLLRQYWQHKNTHTDIYALRTVVDVNAYIAQLHNSTVLIDLTGNLPFAEEEIIITLMEGFSRFSKLQSLKLTNNLIGFEGTNGTAALGRGLRYVPGLESLDLSHNRIGYEGTQGTVVLGHGLQHIPGLQVCSLSHNGIGYEGTQGTVALGRGLQYVPGLQIFDLSHNWIGYQGTDGTEVLGKELQCVPDLQTFDFSQNWIGYKGTEGTEILGHSLGSLEMLRHLNLEQNRIGSTGTAGTESFARALPSLICNGIEGFNLGISIRNLTWQSDERLRETGLLYYSQIEKSCKANTCHGAEVGLPTDITCDSHSNIPQGDICKVFSAGSALRPPFSSFFNYVTLAGIGTTVTTVVASCLFATVAYEATISVVKSVSGIVAGFFSSFTSAANKTPLDTPAKLNQSEFQKDFSYLEKQIKLIKAKLQTDLADVNTERWLSEEDQKWRRWQLEDAESDLQDYRKQIQQWQKQGWDEENKINEFCETLKDIKDKCYLSSKAFRKSCQELETQLDELAENQELELTTKSCRNRLKKLKFHKKATPTELNSLICHIKQLKEEANQTLSEEKQRTIETERPKQDNWCIGIFAKRDGSYLKSDSQMYQASVKSSICSR